MIGYRPGVLPGAHPRRSFSGATGRGTSSPDAAPTARPAPMVIFTAAAYFTVYMTSIHFVRRVLLALPIIALVLGLLHWRSHRRGDRMVVPTIFCLYLVWCLASYGWSADTHDTSHQSLEYVSLAVTGMVAALVLERRELIRALALGGKAFIVMTGTSLVVAYHSAVAPPALDPAPGWHGPVGGKNVLGFLMAIALITIACDQGEPRRKRLWLLTATVLLLGSQSGTALCISLMAAAIYLWRKALRGVTTAATRLLLELVSIVLVLGGGVFLLTDFPAATALLGKNSTLTGRTRIWSAVIAEIPHRLVAGYGFAGVWLNKTGVTAMMWRSIGFQAYEAHDVYLDIILQLGLVGLVLMAVVVVVALVRSLPGLKSRLPSDVWPPLVLLALLVDGVVESDLLATEIFVLAAVATTVLQKRSAPGTVPLVRRDRPLQATAWRTAPSPWRRVGLPGQFSDGEILRDTGWATLLQVVSVGSAAFSFFVLARDLGPTRFGYYSALAGLTGLVSALVNGWVGFVITERVIREGSPAEETVASVASWLAIGGMLALALTALLGPVVVPQIPRSTSVVYVAGAAVGSSLMILGTATTQSVRGFSASTRAPLVRRLISLGLLVGLWATNSITVLAVGLATLAVTTAVGAANLRMCSRRCGVRFRLGRPRWDDIRRGALYAGSLLSFAAEEDIDKPLLVRFGLAGAAGLYSAAYNLVTMCLMPLDAVTAATHNRFLQHDPDALGEHRRRALGLTALSGAYGLLATVAIWVGAPLVPVVLGSRYDGTTQMIRLLGVLVLFRALSIFPFNALMGLGRRGWRVVVVGAAAAVNVGLNVVLIPLLSWKGAVISTAAGEACYVLLAWVGLIRYQHLHDRAVRARTYPVESALVPPVPEPV